MDQKKQDKKGDPVTGKARQVGKHSPSV